MSNIKQLKKLEERLSRIEEEKERSEWMAGFEEELAKYEGEDRVISFSKMRELLAGRKKQEFYKTHIPTLDKLTGGFSKGDLVTISAPTGQGKTSLGRTLTTNLLKENIKSLWLSYEMRPEVFLNLFEEDVVGYLPLQHIARDMIWLERKIVEAIVKYEIGVVFIDHLHYLIDMSSHQSISWRMGEVARKLKKMAIKYDLIVFLMAHIRKTDSEHLTLDDIRDSSMIPQESDFVILLKRIKENGQYTNNTKLQLEKNRRKGVLQSMNLVMRDKLFYEESNREIWEEDD